jgi:O-antigen/teichoic acid export membrane protein
LAIPALLLLAIFKGDLLAIIHPEYGGNSAFMFFLLPIPYLYCSFSLAGNIVAMTGYSKLTLINSLIVSVANILMNLFLIPTLGVVGAALASSVATLILHSFELAEARWVANARLYIRDIYKPHLSGLIAALAMAAGITFVPWFTKGIMEQAVLAVIVLGIFGAFLGSDYIRRVQKKVAKAT